MKVLLGKKKKEEKKEMREKWGLGFGYRGKGGGWCNHRKSIFCFWCEGVGHMIEGAWKPFDIK